LQGLSVSAIRAGDSLLFLGLKWLKFLTAFFGFFGCKEPLIFDMIELDKDLNVSR
jgi:hypothetical protein